MTSPDLSDGQSQGEESEFAFLFNALSDPKMKKAANVLLYGGLGGGGGSLDSEGYERIRNRWQSVIWQIEQIPPDIGTQVLRTLNEMVEIGKVGFSVDMAQALLSRGASLKGFQCLKCHELNSPQSPCSQKTRGCP